MAQIHKSVSIAHIKYPIVKWTFPLSMKERDSVFDDDYGKDADGIDYFWQ